MRTVADMVHAVITILIRMSAASHVEELSRHAKRLRGSGGTRRRWCSGNRRRGQSDLAQSAYNLVSTITEEAKQK